MAAGRGDGRLRGGAFGTLACRSRRLEGALEASLRYGNGGAMLVLRVPEMGRLKTRNQRRHTAKIIAPRVRKTTIWNSSRQWEQ